MLPADHELHAAVITNPAVELPTREPMQQKQKPPPTTLEQSFAPAPTGPLNPNGTMERPQQTPVARKLRMRRSFSEPDALPVVFRHSASAIAQLSPAWQERLKRAYEEPRRPRPIPTDRHGNPIPPSEIIGRLFQLYDMRRSGQVQRLHYTSTTDLLIQTALQARANGRRTQTVDGSAGTTSVNARGSVASGSNALTSGSSLIQKHDAIIYNARDSNPKP